MRVSNLLFAAALLLFAALAAAAPPYDVRVTVTAPTDGGPVDSYELRVNGVPSGVVAVGATDFPGLITADGTYVFQVAATNVAGTTLSDPVTQTITGITAPGKPGVTIQVDCDPCIITVAP